MSYKIPSDELVLNALRRVIVKARIVQSQRVLHELVSAELQQKNKKYSVTQKRLRLLALNQPFVKVEIHSREGNPKKTLHRCPVCHHQLKRVRNLTIWGGMVTIELRCPHCGYWTGKKKRIPTRYVFHYAENKKR